MSEELNKQLAALAQKLGVSVEHIWSVLIRQAYIDGLSSLATVFGCVIMAFATIWIFLYCRRKTKTYAEPTHSFWSTAESCSWIVLLTVLLVLFFIAANNVYWVISDFFNPEFYALRHLPGVTGQ